jgi:hypothetical protein
MKRSFFVRAIWDDEAKVFYSESDIDGLHIEAPTMDVFEEVVLDVAADVIAANHRSSHQKGIEYVGFN